MNRTCGNRRRASSTASAEVSMPTHRYRSASAAMLPPVPQPTSTTRVSSDGGSDLRRQPAENPPPPDKPPVAILNVGVELELFVLHTGYSVGATDD